VFPSPHDKQLPLKVSENFLISAYIARLALAMVVRICMPVRKAG
jgi:hypothetical protein